MTSKLVTPPSGGNTNTILSKDTASDGDVVWKELMTPCELFVSLDNGGSWYGGLSTAPSFYTSFVPQTGQFHLYMTGAGAQVNRISMTGQADTGLNDYFYVLFAYGGTTSSDPKRVPVIVKLDYVGSIQKTDTALSPLPFESPSTVRSLLYGGQIIARA